MLYQGLHRSKIHVGQSGEAHHWLERTSCQTIGNRQFLPSAKWYWNNEHSWIAQNLRSAKLVISSDCLPLQISSRNDLHWHNTEPYLLTEPLKQPLYLIILMNLISQKCLLHGYDIRDVHHGFIPGSEHPRSMYTSDSPIGSSINGLPPKKKILWEKHWETTMLGWLIPQNHGFLTRNCTIWDGCRWYQGIHFYGSGIGWACLLSRLEGPQPHHQPSPVELRGLGEAANHLQHLQYIDTSWFANKYGWIRMVYV